MLPFSRSNEGAIRSDFPLSFPRRDKVSVPPPNRRHASVATTRRTSVQETSSRASGSGGGSYAGGSFHLVVHDASVGCATASVSARRLDELFFGASTTATTGATSGGEDVEGVAATDAVEGRRESGHAHVTSSAGRGGRVLRDCGLFEELIPLSLSGSAPARCEAGTSSMAVTEDTAFSSPMPAARKKKVLKSLSHEKHRGDLKPGEGSPDGSGSDQYSASGGIYCGTGGPAAWDTCMQTDGFAKTPVSSQRKIGHGEACGGDSSGSSSVQETPSPKVT